MIFLWFLELNPNRFLFINWLFKILYFFKLLFRIANPLECGLISSYEIWFRTSFRKPHRLIFNYIKICTYCHQFYLCCSIPMVNRMCSVINIECKLNLICRFLLLNMGNMYFHNVTIIVTYHLNFLSNLISIICRNGQYNMIRMLLNSNSGIVT